MSASVPEWASLLLDGVWPSAVQHRLCLQPLREVLHQLRRGRPVTAVHLHDEAPCVEGNFAEIGTRRAVPFLWGHPCVIKGSQGVCSWDKTFQLHGEVLFCLKGQLSITPLCPALRDDSRVLAWLASLHPESSRLLPLEITVQIPVFPSLHTGRNCW